MNAIWFEPISISLEDKVAVESKLSICSGKDLHLISVQGGHQMLGSNELSYSSSTQKKYLKLTRLESSRAQLELE